MPYRVRLKLAPGLLIVGAMVASLCPSVAVADPVGLKRAAAKGEAADREPAAAATEPQSRQPPAVEQPAPPPAPGPGVAGGLPLKEIEEAYAGEMPPESVRMLLGITRGAPLGPGSGWYGPAESRYSWNTLAELHGVAEADGIPADAFRGTGRWFTRLDRNRDGRITRDDLDWSDRNPWVRQASLVDYLFSRIGAGPDGKLTRDELTAFFEAAAGGKDHLLPEDLRNELLGGYQPSFTPGDAPSRAMLIKGLFAGDYGSLNEGPAVDTRAPDFSLKTHDGTRTVRLADLLGGDKPVVLTFGNFTCGPFRYMFPGVEAVHTRFADEATFIAVYVREAHPTDGWRMETNEKAGVAVAQPKTYAERTAVATQCHGLLKPAMPLLVDEINDPVGHAYSGMPARLYVIDRHGKIAYKAGRGPFGFKAGEMEQALVMTLLDQRQATPEMNPADAASDATPAAAKSE